MAHWWWTIVWCVEPSQRNFIHIRYTESFCWVFYFKGDAKQLIVSRGEWLRTSREESSPICPKNALWAFIIYLVNHFELFKRNATSSVKLTDNCINIVTIFLQQADSLKEASQLRPWLYAVPDTRARRAYARALEMLQVKKWFWLERMLLCVCLLLKVTYVVFPSLHKDVICF